MPSIPNYDVVIVGGGPAGCATALSLIQRGLRRILVVEAGDYEQTRVGESIPPDTSLLLRELGLWDDFVAQRHEPCLGSCSSWGADELGYNDFLFNPLGTGWHLDRQRFDELLASRVASGGAEIWMSTRCDSWCRTPSGGHRLQLSPSEERAAGRPDGNAAVSTAREVETRFVVDATGQRASFAKKQGARKVDLDRMVCAYGFFELQDETAFSKLTLLEAVEYGWWYAAKLPAGRLAVAVATDSAIVRAENLRAEESWLAHLAATRHLSARLGECRFIPGSVFVCPAASFRLDCVAADGWLAVGDAASAFDPICSQGIHKAVADGIAAGAAVVGALSGDAAASDGYVSQHTARFGDYLDNRRFFYLREQRWPQAAFWSRRHARVSLSSGTLNDRPELALGARHHHG